MMLITGASGGLGEWFARLAAADRQDLILVARSLDKLSALAESLARRHGIRATAMAYDLSQPGSIDVLAGDLEARGFQIDVLINDAGFGVWGPFVRTPEAEDRNMINLNVLALTMLTKRVVPGMLARGRGRVMNVASTAAFQPGPLMAVYYATKAYILSFSEALAAELEGTGVTVTCFCPGLMATGFQARARMERARMLGLLRPMDAERAARAGYEGMKAGRRLVIPGLVNNLTTRAMRVFPRRFVTGTVGWLNAE